MDVLNVGSIASSIPIGLVQVEYWIEVAQVQYLVGVVQVTEDFGGILSQAVGRALLAHQLNPFYIPWQTPHPGLHHILPVPSTTCLHCCDTIASDKHKVALETIAICDLQTGCRNTS